MAANQAGIGADSFYKRIFWAFYRIFYRRLGRISLIPRFGFECNRAYARE